MRRITITKAEALKQFKEYHLPSIILKFGKDKIAIQQGWNEYTDYLCKDREITMKQYESWSNPF